MKFYVLAPEYRENSAGVVQLYRFCDELKRQGFSAEIVKFGQSAVVSKDTVVVYPEIIPDNPLAAEHVVRYFLNREGLALNNPVWAGPRDFILAFLPEYHPQPHAILNYFDFPDYFTDQGAAATLNRNLDCVYIGKGKHYFPDAAARPGTLSIPRDQPISRPALADLLRQTRLLYTWDLQSALVAEAILCGAWVVPERFHPFPAESLSWPWITVEQNRLIIPMDYSQRRDQFITQLRNSNREFGPQCQRVAEQIQQHFAL